MNYLVISNGTGEDLIATNLIDELAKQDPSANISAIPLVGSGHSYKASPTKILIQNPSQPSGGFIRNISTLFKDIQSGIISQHISQHRLIKSTSQDIEKTIIVGDIFALVLGSYKNPSPIYFLPTAKSSRFMPHSKIEINLMKRFATAIFPRDEETAAHLQSEELNAHFLGRPMTDNLVPSKQKFGFKPTDQVLGILPGSRQEAYQNCLKCLQVVESCFTQKPDLKYCMSIAPSFNLSTLKQTLLPTPWRLIKDQTTPHLFHARNGISIILSTDFIDIVNQSNVLIGLAGTANEQAVYLGRTVITFKGTGPQSTRKRFKEQQKLLGDKLKWLHPYDPKNIAKEISTFLIKNPIKKPLNKLPNSAKSIIQHIL